MFQPCEICSTDSWQVIYEGGIRAGAFGTRRDGAKVGVCAGCGAARLAEQFSIPASDYESDAYRQAMAQGLGVQAFQKMADPLQIHNLAAFWPLPVRGSVVADVGCGAGSFLDHVAGVAAKVVAIEPTVMYHPRLQEQGYEVYQYASEVIEKRPASVDLAVSFHVIEHVLDPRAFVDDIAAMLKPGGVMMIATPNREDILMKLLPEEFGAFFYRTAHRWYFDASSFRKCVEGVPGVTVDSLRFVHTFGLSNAFSWMKDRRPTGNARLPGIDAFADRAWVSYLEATGQADTLFLMAKKAAS